MTPFESEDLTEFILEENGRFIVLRSPDSAEDKPNYQELGNFPTHAEAEAFLDSYEPI
ncbi:hypothetical protein [Bradyrhizobium sp.]|uniref:hypothetical protein n=1 Tax=Bradyrhizobium sp. TaxID=376 RepID=UPI002639C917|nr:hypothetical protein [Bradyrhizobium sp.]